jgi:hypothetical protein
MRKASCTGVLWYDQSADDAFAVSCARFVATGELFVPLRRDIRRGSLDQEISRLPSLNVVEAHAIPIAETEGASETSIVLSGCRADVLAPATTFSLGTGRRLYFDASLEAMILEVARLDISSITVFAELRELKPTVLDLLWSLARDRELRFGIVPVRSRAETEWWVIKRLFGSDLYERHLGGVILARNETASRFEDSALVIPESRFDSTQTRRLSTPHEICLAEFHAKECCARFNQHVVCGRPLLGAVGPEFGTTAFPSCGDGEPCIWRFERIPIVDLNATHFVAVSCGSLRLANRLFDASFGLGLNIFAGAARSYVSPIRFVVSNSFLSSLISDCVFAGMTLGKVVNDANRLLRMTLSDADCFVLLGDPEDSIDVGRALSSSAAEPAPALPLTEVILKRTSVEEGDYSEVAAIATSEVDPLADDCARALVPRELIARLSPECITSSALLKRIAYHDNREGYWLSLEYAGCSHRATENLLPCLSCGNACVTYEREDDERHWRRLIVNCPTCGIVADVPDGGYGRVTLTAPPIVSASEDFEIVSTARSNDPLRGMACGLSLIHCRDFGWSSFEAETPTLSLIESGAVSRVRVSVEPTAYRFAYWLRATWLMSDGIFWVSRPLIIGKK